MITDKGRQELRGWFAGRLPESWFTELVEVSADREEITLIGRIPEPQLPPGTPTTEFEAACEGRITEFRERTRMQRVEVAREAQLRFRRQLSWGARCGHSQEMFTHISAPVMTRLKQPERLVLDTLIAGGVARSRSDALAWCVRLVERHTDTWLADLRESLHGVEQVRTEGPAPATLDGLEGSALEKQDR
ncbi:hypothetical protein [Streptomyces profundus]|uniref:hypothetical protein n=1 Tax=Streptomyces profundus TaxID=2867410 RepID=UPI001D16410A|nr:hypothetical protein [Streptomyces sp. MA3_2.13]UED83766.1 hypothetical protein K4G22_05685 [Streptomyces sp. MA3_2.13]